MTQYYVFDQNILLNLARKHQETFRALAEIEVQLNERFTEMGDPIRALILAVASGEPLLFIGPPGTAKSRLIRVFCEYVGVNVNDVSRENREYFEYLLTPFTEPGELFGYYNIVETGSQKKLVRDESGMMQQAIIVYLDEVFNGSSAILNSLLAFMNERVFHDRGEIKKVRLKSLFGATNDIPTTGELRAIYDRFLLRVQVGNVRAGAREMRELLKKGWQETYYTFEPKTYPGLLDRLEAFREDIRRANLQFVPESEFFQKLAQHVEHIRRMDLSEMSNRRLVKYLHLMLIHSVYESVRSGQLDHGVAFGEKEMALMRFALDVRDELSEQALAF